MPKTKRGLATALVAAVGVAGGIASALVSQHFDWRTCYIIGGIGGLVLLFLRVGVHESGMFEKIKEAPTRFADFKLLFTEGRGRIYLACVLLGIPLWYFAGLVVIFSPEIGQGLGVVGTIVAAKAVFSYSIGFGLGDVLSGLLSQYFKSRKKVIGGFLVGSFLSLALLLSVEGQTPTVFYVLCGLAGFFIGYWALLLTTAAEHFGTNIRATVTTTVPNFVRGSTVILTLSFAALKPSLGVVGAIQAIGLVVFILAAASLWTLRETFHQDMDFIERSR